MEGFCRLSRLEHATSAGTTGPAARATADLRRRLPTRFPGTRIILGHMGEFLPAQLYRIDARYAISTPKSATAEETALRVLPDEHRNPRRPAMFLARRADRRDRDHRRGQRDVLDRLPVRASGPAVEFMRARAAFPRGQGKSCAQQRRTRPAAQLISHRLWFGRTVCGGVRTTIRVSRQRRSATKYHRVTPRVGDVERARARSPRP